MDACVRGGGQKVECVKLQWIPDWREKTEERKISAKTGAKHLKQTEPLLLGREENG